MRITLFIIVKVATYANIIQEMRYDNNLDARAPATFAQLDQLNKYTKIIKANEIKVEPSKKITCIFLVVLNWLPREMAANPLILRQYIIVQQLYFLKTNL